MDRSPTPATAASALDQNGRLVTLDGYAVMPGINVPQNSQNLTIGPDGTVSVQVGNQTLPSQVGQLQIINFLNPSGLQPMGQNLYKLTQASGAPADRHRRAEWLWFGRAGISRDAQ